MKLKILGGRDLRNGYLVSVTDLRNGYLVSVTDLKNGYSVSVILFLPMLGLEATRAEGGLV